MTSPALRTAIVFELPLRLVNDSNTRQHWRPVAKRAREQRLVARAWLRGLLQRREHFGVVLRSGLVRGRTTGGLDVKITRIGPRELDDDNLAISAKHVRDGLADALGLDDGDSRLKWGYAQEKRRTYGVRIEIEVREGGA